MNKDLILLMALSNVMQDEYGSTPLTESEIETVKDMYLFEMTGLTKAVAMELPMSELEKFDKDVEEVINNFMIELKDQVLGGKK